MPARLLSLLAPLAVALVPAAATRPAAANEVTNYLHQELKSSAGLILDAAQQAKLTRVKFDNFLPPAYPSGGQVTGVKEAVIELFRKAAEARPYQVKIVTEDDGAPPDLIVTATMKYLASVKVGESVKEAVLQINFQLTDKDGKIDEIAKQVVKRLAVEGQVLDSPNPVRSLLGIGGVVHHEAEGGGADAEVARSTKELLSQRPANPTNFFIDGKDHTIARPSRTSPFGVEVLVSDQPLKSAAEWATMPAAKLVPGQDNRRPRVELKASQSYALRLSVKGQSTPTQYDAAAEISIDGLDVFHFVDNSLRKADGRPRYPAYICGRAAGKDKVGETIIPGWHHTNDEAFAFNVAELGKESGKRKAVATQAGTPGMIGVRFAYAWGDGEAPPEAFLGQNAEKVTDVGPPVQSKAVEVKRHLGPIRGEVCIQYSH